MAAKKQQTHAKRARELAVKERRERKRAKKAEAAAIRAAGGTLDVEAQADPMLDPAPAEVP
jgi:hypothetical protein